MNTYIVTFYSHFSAIAFHRAMKKMGIHATLMPIPRNLSSSCGTCVKLSPDTPDALDYSSFDGLEKVFDVSGPSVLRIYEA